MITAVTVPQIRLVALACPANAYPAPASVTPSPPSAVGEASDASASPLIVSHPKVRYIRTCHLIGVPWAKAPLVHVLPLTFTLLLTSLTLPPSPLPHRSDSAAHIRYVRTPQYAQDCADGYYQGQGGLGGLPPPPPA